jgi:ketosteroid isomerase-like protein
MAALDFAEAVDKHHSALAEFVKGDPEPLKEMYSHGEDVSLANPFGPPIRGWEQAAERMERAASYYADGEVVGFDTIARLVTSELAYTVEIEHYRARVGGAGEMSPIVLRVTSIFRPEDGAWKLVHRHADPITSARPAESVIQK